MNMVLKKTRGRPKKEEGRRHADRQVMIDAAVDLLREGGSAALSARLVAERAGTAVGSVYTQFDSMEALRLEANAITMRILRDTLSEALAASRDEPTDKRLLRLADAYLRFSVEHNKAWAAMFERRTIAAPPAIAADIAALFAILENVLRDAGLPNEDDVPTIARALWSSVHGMVYLSEIGALGPVGPAEVPAMVKTLVSVAVRGLTTPR